MLPTLPSLPSLRLLPALIAGLFAANATHAQLLPNMDAPPDQRPVLLRSANGTPQIDITRPSAAGVSVNQFRQFDIDQQGAVVNNSRTAAETNIAGWITANPALISGEARVIVNEVRSNNPSLLNGYVEIAGGKADFIIANPSGISCNGCGFINAARVELATAKPNIEDGKLNGYAMGNGALEFAGNGLDASRADALSLLTQAARVNAGIWAKDLKLDIKAPPGTPDTSAAPSFALDVAQVGGMYANRIWLVGSAHGLGVRNAGNWSASETLVVSINGKLENSGTMDARDLKIQATNLDNVAQGKILGERVVLQADRIANAGHPDASPVIAAAADLDIGARVLENTDQATLFSGNDMRIGRELDAHGYASGKAEQVLNRFSTIESLGKLSIHTSLLQNLNAGVDLEEVQIGQTVDMAYLKPSGSAQKYTMDHFYWTKWSRAGQYKWVTNEANLTNGIPGKTPLPDVDGSDCTEEGGVETCTSTPGSAYLRDDPAWAYFKLTPPDLPPPQPGQEPWLPDVAKPPPLEATAPDADRLAWAEANARYEAVMGEYQLNKERHDLQVSAYDSWKTTTSQRREALNEAINIYNEGFGDINIRSWTQYAVQHSEFESRVVRSEPGRIVAGSDMVLVGEDLLNDRSQIIAGGTLAGDLQNLRSIDAIGTYRVHESGTSQVSRSNYRGWLRNYHTREWGPKLPYEPADQLATQHLPVTVTAGEQAGKLPAAAFDVAASRVAADGSSLFKLNLSSGPLFVTDPRFTQYRQWLNSDAMLAQLAYDPERLQKRLGDGYIEQRMIREQIAQLTGRRFLPGQDNDEAQYAALMASGVHQATALQLQPGIALTASQMAKLTADIVWLVEQDIAVPARDGQPAKTVRALVPRVYLLPRAGDLDGGGTLISGQRVALSVADAIDNAGTINGTDGLLLKARTINNSGTLTGDNALLIATDDINILGGVISTRHQQQLWAGRDIRVASTTRDSTRQSTTSQATGKSAGTNIDRVALLHVANSGDLQMLAGRDIALDAAQIVNQGSGNIAAIAGHDLTLGTIATRSTLSARAHRSANSLSEAQSTEVGTHLQAQGSIFMAAGQDLAARAASIDSKSAGVTLSAERDLAIKVGESSISLGQGTEFRERGFLSSGTSIRRTAVEQKNALASTISGNTVDLQAGQDLSIAGSDVTSDRNTRLHAGRDVSITAATESTFSESFSRDTRSGLLSGPGLSIGIGSQRQQNTSELRSTHQRGSQVGTLAGDVSIDAGDSYRQQASKVVAPGGSVTITAVNVDITGGTDTSDSRQASSFSQSGLSITLSNPVIDAARTLESLHNASQETRSSRAQVLAAAAAGLAVTDAAKQVAKDPSHAGGITLAATIGSSKSESTATEHATRVAPSVVAAGGSVDIRAQGRPDARLAITGSQIGAGDTVKLKSDGELVLEAQANTSTQSMSSHSSSAGIGLAARISQEGTGVGIIASASKGKGKSAGDDITWTNTEITAGRRASLHSNGDSQLKGATVKAPTIDAHVGGNLLIESLQDSSHYESRQQSFSGSVIIPLPGGGSPSAQFNMSNSAIHSHYLSTNEASGLRAGDGGFQVQVTGQTELKGTVIASTDAAVNAGVNQFSSAELAMSDLKNKAEYDAKAYGVGIGVGSNPQGEYAPKGNSAGLGSDSGHQSSVTTAGISGIAGNQDVRTGDASSGLGKIFDAEKVANEINAQVAITQEFSGQAYRAVDDYVSLKRSELTKALKASEEAKDEIEQQAIKASLTQLRREEQVMNILIGAVIGLGASAVTKEGLSAAAEEMRSLMLEDSRKFVGVTDGKTVISNMSGESEGVRSDGKKLGGSRIDPDLICGKNNENCKVVRDSSGNPVLDANGKTTLALNDQNMIVFISSEKYASLENYLESPEGQEMYGPTGGIQGYVGTLFGTPYLPGSWQDRLIEAFAGTHDYLGGKLPGMYDSQGNIKRGMSASEKDSMDRGSVIAILPSTPFAMAELLKPAVWSAISIILKSAR